MEHERPLSAAQIRKSVRQGMRDIIQRVGVTSILVTHDQEEAFDIADQIVIFNRHVLLHSSCWMCSTVLLLHAGWPWIVS